MAEYKVDARAIEQLANTLETFGTKGEEVINAVFATTGYERVAQCAQGLIHASGRTFKGHTTSATQAAYTSVFGKVTGNLSVTVQSQGKYGYLYFPDDGGNSRRHAGHQEFMRRGAEEALPELVREIQTRLIQEF